MQVYWLVNLGEWASVVECRHKDTKVLMDCSTVEKPRMTRESEMFGSITSLKRWPCYDN